MSLTTPDQLREFGEKCPLTLRLEIIKTEWWSDHKSNLELINNDISDENWKRITEACHGLHMKCPPRPKLQTAMPYIKKIIEEQCKFIEECQEEFEGVSEDGALIHLYTQGYQLTVLEPVIEFQFQDSGEE